ncbi:MAG: CoA-binding protein [Planctomycetaceae bacterium]
MTPETQIAEFLDGSRFAVAGASTDRDKYGNKVLRVYQQKGYDVVPINPKADTVEGIAAVASLKDIAEPVHGLSIVTPPSVTERVVNEAIELGIRHIWMQPGAESDAAVTAAHQAGVNLIHGGPCVLVVLGFRDH